MQQCFNCNNHPDGFVASFFHDGSVFNFHLACVACGMQQHGEDFDGFRPGDKFFAGFLPESEQQAQEFIFWWNTGDCARCFEPTDSPVQHMADCRKTWFQF